MTHLSKYHNGHLRKAASWGGYCSPIFSNSLMADKILKRPPQALEAISAKPANQETESHQVKATS
jgi:hypothetical protein